MKLDSTSSLLIVDDDFLLRLSYLDILENKVGEVFEASDGGEAFRILQQHPEIDAVISDLNMKEVDGDALFRMMRSAGDYRPFVMISGATGEERDDVEHILFEGGNAKFLEKPTNYAEIVSAFDGLMTVDQLPDYPAAKM